MKSLFLGLALCLSALAATAQTETSQQRYPLPEGRKLWLNLRFADSINISAHDGNEVVLVSHVQINHGKLNKALLLKANATDGQLSIENDFDKELMKQGRPEDCPEQDRKYINQSWALCTQQIYYELKVPRRADLKVESISGSITLRNLEGKVWAKSISGYVDLAWNPAQGANLEAKTLNGEIYTNLEVALSNKNRPDGPMGQQLKGQVAKGGPTLHIESISGDIFLRKQ